jgi:predicted HNH restriction endonuclease
MPVTVADVIEALSLLGGQASVEEIFQKVERIARPPIPPSIRQIIRARLQNYCAESNSFNGRRNLFRNVHGFSARRGIWALREDVLSPSNPDLMIDEAEPMAMEGIASLRQHLRKERSRALISRFKEGLSDLSCRVCGFDFAAFYGEVGIGYIEAHHTKPVASLEPEEPTRLSDLVAVCSNCHRMLHRRSLMDWRSLKALLVRATK